MEMDAELQAIAPPSGLTAIVCVCDDAVRLTLRAAAPDADAASPPDVTEYLARLGARAAAAAHRLKIRFLGDMRRLACRAFPTGGQVQLTWSILGNREDYEDSADLCIHGYYMENLGEFFELRWMPAWARDLGLPEGVERIAIRSLLGGPMVEVCRDCCFIDFRDSCGVDMFRALSPLRTLRSGTAVYVRYLSAGGFGEAAADYAESFAAFCGDRAWTLSACGAEPWMFHIPWGTERAPRPEARLNVYLSGEGSAVFARETLPAWIDAGRTDARVFGPHSAVRVCLYHTVKDEVFDRADAAGPARALYQRGLVGDYLRQCWLEDPCVGADADADLARCAEVVRRLHGLQPAADPPPPERRLGAVKLAHPTHDLTKYLCGFLTKRPRRACRPDPPPPCPPDGSGVLADCNLKTRA